MRVVLCRCVQVGERFGSFKKVIDLPAVLIPGMGIVVDDGCDPVPVQQAFYNFRLELIVQLEDCRYSDGDFIAMTSDQKERDSLWRFYTDGWMDAGESILD